VTQPSEQPSSPSSSSKKAPSVKVLDVVQFTRHDPITGHDHTDVGVVVDVDANGGPLVVRPLAAHHHTDVDPANVQVLAAGDVG
jgi:hypothetical protein